MNGLLDLPAHEKRARAFAESASNLKLTGCIHFAFSADDNEFFLKQAQEIAKTDPVRGHTLTEQLIEAKSLEKRKTKVIVSFTGFPSEMKLNAALQTVAQLAQEHSGTLLPLSKTGVRTKRIVKIASQQNAKLLGMMHSSLNGYDDLVTYGFS